MKKEGGDGVVTDNGALNIAEKRGVARPLAQKPRRLVNGAGEGLPLLRAHDTGGVQQSGAAPLCKRECTASVEHAARL